ncbi:helix-turn-helix transcriptional regulator [Parasediminibacterium sp. JCM 36343]|uniref:helix-turn-helix transcriptional regulator n=1 Tax=Parasediminibacterium sp. JCM 36343 TaxID=3374279 RepID=UPI00397A78A7
MEHGRIPNSLKRYRRMAGISQTEVAGMLGLKKTSCVSRWERGAAFPSTVHLLQLSLLYKTLPSNLYADLWDILKGEIRQMEQELLARKESLISNERFFL